MASLREGVKYYCTDFVCKRGTPPPLRIFFRQGGSYGFGGTPPLFTDKICKVVFEVLPKRPCSILLAQCGDSWHKTLKGTVLRRIWLEWIWMASHPEDDRKWSAGANVCSLWNAFPVSENFEHSTLSLKTNSISHQHNFWWRFSAALAALHQVKLWALHG